MEGANEFFRAARVIPCELDGIEASVGDVAAATARDAYLGKELAALLQQDDGREGI